MIFCSARDPTDYPAPERNGEREGARREDERARTCVQEQPDTDDTDDHRERPGQDRKHPEASLRV